MPLHVYTAQNIQGATTISATFALDAASTSTPTASPTPPPSPPASPTPTPDSTPALPELPSWIIPTLLITVATGAGLLAYFRKRKR